MSILQAPVIRRYSIPSLFQIFVLILRAYILENIIVLIFGLRPYFVLFGLHTPSFDLFVLHYFFCVQSKLYCAIIKATQSYLEHEEARLRY